jgi:acetyltransferase-like isoleucine patch superfamily enzyme
MHASTQERTMNKRNSALTLDDRALLGVHPSAIVEPGAVIGPETRIWHQTHVRSGSVIGARCTIGFGVYVDAATVIGDRCKIQNQTSIFRGVTLEDDVFVGPLATFTNDEYPRAFATDWQVTPTIVRRGASIGANATIRCGVEIGAYALVACGAVVTRDVPAHALVVGVPARVERWVCFCGRPLAVVGSVLPERCEACGAPAPAI